MAAPLPAPAADALTPPQREAIDGQIRAYILEHPEVLVESLKAYQEKQELARQTEAQSAIANLRPDLENDPSTPVAGNPKGDITIVEFFDYRCGYCKRVLPIIQEMLKTDDNIRYVFKEYPILGPESVIASRAALAAWKVSPEKYFDFHVALLGARGSLTEDSVLNIAAEVGLDRNRVRTAMNEPWVEEKIRRNHEIGRKIDINGTPAFIINGRLVPGAISMDQMKEMIAEARKG